MDAGPKRDTHTPCQVLNVPRQSVSSLNFQSKILQKQLTFTALTMAEDDERRKVDKSVEREFSQQRNDQSILLDALEGLSAGMSPVQPSPAIAKPRRDRTVSWDINVPADLIDAPPNHDLSPVTPPQSSNVTTGKLSLKDIKDSSPIEDEAVR
jgi:hypothetical protein